MLDSINAEYAPRPRHDHSDSAPKRAKAACGGVRATAERLEARRLLSANDINLWVSPNGTGNGQSQSTPESLATVLQTTLPNLTRPTNGNVVVNLEGGTYTGAGSTIALTSADGDSVNGQYVIFQNAPGAQPVISGGASVTGWTQVVGSTAYEASIGSLGIVRELYVNGQRLTRARLPVSGYSHILSWNGLGSVKKNKPYPNTLGNASLTATVPYSVDPNLASDAAKGASGGNPVELVVIQGYTISRLRIQRASNSGGTSPWVVHFYASDVTGLIQEKGLGATFYTTRPQPFYLDNVPISAASLQPGQWYEDNTAGKFYYQPVQSGEMSTDVFTVATALSDPNQPTMASSLPAGTLPTASNPLLDVGTMGSGTITNVQLSGLTFEYSSFDDPTVYGYVTLGLGLATRSPNKYTKWTYLSQTPAVRLMNAQGVTIGTAFLSTSAAQGSRYTPRVKTIRLAAIPSSMLAATG